MNNLDLDNIHRQMNDLAAKRASGIAEHGTDYFLTGTERTFKAIATEDQTAIMFEASAPIQAGQLWESKAGTICILKAESFPGCKAAKTAQVVANARVLVREFRSAQQGTVEVLAPTAQTLSILKREPGAVTVPLRHAGVKGVLEIGGDRLEIVGSQLKGYVAILLTKQYVEPQQKQLGKEQAKPWWVTSGEVKGQGYDVAGMVRPPERPVYSIYDAYRARR